MTQRTKRMNKAWQDLREALEGLRTRIVQSEATQLPLLEQQDPSLPWHLGIRNMLHYLALRSVDLRPLQEALSDAGLSSLGRAESHVLDSVQCTLQILYAALQMPPADFSDATAITREQGQRALTDNTLALLGSPPRQRSTHIMVTLSGDRADDADFFRRLLTAGMNIARINCAHDSPGIWRRLAEQVRTASRDTGQPCRILADLAGHKIRTGPLPDAPGVIHLRPERDRLGRLLDPARMTAMACHQAHSSLPPGADCLLLLVSGSAMPQQGEDLLCHDARGKERVLVVERVENEMITLQATQGCYFIAGNRCRSRRRRHVQGYFAGIPQSFVPLHLEIGDSLLLQSQGGPGGPALNGLPARISCTVPEVIPQLPIGQPVWMDDGKIAAVVLEQTSAGALLRITKTKPGGARLLPDRGLNFPGLALELPALSAKDLDDLGTIVPLADLVGFSFVENAGNMRSMLEALRQRQGEHLGVIAKIETASAFHHLPEILLAALGRQPMGVMIARGDLAVEVGPERLAEVQEEILWLAEAAHLPVIWATQVLEQLTKKGVISRPEFTDAAMGVRAECVMLNKGPYAVEAVHTLNDILTRMQAHQHKKFSRLRALHWGASGEPPDQWPEPPR
ncbi:pyruvate kinase [Acidithiobacillus ferrooxidans]|jgi:pyruvate kinase|uniref:pyruvate kinase n=2 Tax=Acidithiobacillus ferrooxidans TaxID=920 RepID=A0A2W1K690_ACIFR|nr:MULTISPECIES: pyruvate kinase [Acidithiobacillus]ACH83146.1 Pyruvate kinase [Acidithiobacillus ferrooxidans ATCC 53993]MBN6744971.1 pyruvate kinase [Acidithiobacillus sp. MC2.2]MBN6747918.1 pyruvate kinase [Acidithiobacillus sp. PG05]MBU2775259.1 pyruvate kinase [Acidithiobacillus ferrooxidans]MBU2816953.1 pyruvate kinase [Acidithiobacillus ferrooxidans]